MHTVMYSMHVLAPLALLSLVLPSVCVCIQICVLGVVQNTLH
jgi:hypothetical protein